MIGIGLGILWVGYTALATGRAYSKGIPVTFSDMVLPKYRTATIAMLKQGGAGGNTSGAKQQPPGTAQQLGNTGLFGLSGVFAGPIESGDKGIIGVGSAALKAIANGLGNTLKDIGL